MARPGLASKSLLSSSGLAPQVNYVTDNTDLPKTTAVQKEVLAKGPRIYDTSLRSLPRLPIKVSTVPLRSCTVELETIPFWNDKSRKQL